MGTACYTPLKREFLWWYWLLLASVVGIPMFLAAWYVSHRSETEDDRKRLGIAASRVFVASGFVSVALAAALACWLHKHRLHVHLVGGYVICMLLANSICRSWRTDQSVEQRLGSIILHVVLWWLICFLVAHLLPVYSLATFVLEPSVCLLPAICWYRFVDRPTQRNAVGFLVALVVGAFLFWAVAQLWPVPPPDFGIELTWLASGHHVTL